MRLKECEVGLNILALLRTGTSSSLNPKKNQEASQDLSAIIVHGALRKDYF
ncbi:hypothetical protein C8R26_12337 [Nitrosomonas oligotropha]|uniref:Uncharacterized protein n=1 Tax=Nitrosomonas oligotropha TaxID=42354 RepID=A0A2T5HX18_9PROT|nr:hypothetical protein C8R26_12337 [Nitrosomonas oligotropha]